MAAVDPQPLIDAIQAAVKAAGVACDVGAKPKDATTRWVVLWPNAGTVGDRSLRSRDGLDVVVTVHAYGTNPRGASYALRAARDAIMGRAGESVAGRTVQLPAHVVARDLDRDDDVAPPLWWLHDEWRFALTH